ncbi:MAG TPA: response regulator transcription factor [Candidatus Dormibacteraeota bacterium]|nr:response regulator transcription factor [Candidatus Dormibacteraeota bacterium]
MCPHAQIREGKTIRCVLVHDLVLLRQGLRRLLDDEPDVEVVAEAGSAAEGLRKIFEHRPEVVITDAQIFHCAADQAEQLILEQSRYSKVLFLTTRDEHELRGAAAVDGTQYAVRRTSADELVTMVRKTAATKREANRSGEVREFPVEEFSSRKRGLTAREQEVLKLLAEGRTVRSVAAILGLSAKTVDAHKFNLMRKLGIHNKAELVMWAIQKRVVKLPVNF